MPKILKRKVGQGPILEEQEIDVSDLLSPTPSTPPPIPQSPTAIPNQGVESLDDYPDDEPEIGSTISRDELKLPPVPGTYLNWEQWESYASKLTGNHWSHVDCYLYRHDPIIDQEPKYIDVFGQWRDFNYYVSTHGGGKYGLSVCDRALSKRQQEICKVRIDIDKQKFDPILNLATLDLGDKRNRAYITKLVNQGKLSPDLEILQMQPRGAQDQSELVNKLVDKVTDLATSNNNRDNKPTNQLENQAASKAIDMVTDVYKRSMDQQMNASDPMKMVDTMSKLITMVQPKADNSGLEIMKLMMEMQREANTALRESIKSTNERMEKLIEKIGTQSNGNNNPSSLTDSLDVMLQIADRLGGGKEQSIAQSLIGMGREVLPHFMGPLAQFVMAKQGGALPIQSNPQQLPPGPNGSNVVEMPTPGAQPPMSNVTKEQVAQFISQFGPRITNAMERGDTGANLAQSLETLMGYDTYLQVRAVIEDKSLVMEGAQMVPQFWTLVKGHGIPKFEEFLDSFLEWSSLREQDDNEGGV